MREETLCTFDYAAIRFVPLVEREEFFNVGVILSCHEHKFLDCRIYLSETKLKALAPDFEFETAQKYLAVIPKICAADADAGVIGKLPPRERFYWLTAHRSTVIQASAIHTGFCREPQATLEHLFRRIVL